MDLESYTAAMWASLFSDTEEQRVKAMKKAMDLFVSELSKPSIPTMHQIKRRCVPLNPVAWEEP